MTYRSPTAIAPQAPSRYRRDGEVPDYKPPRNVAEEMANERLAKCRARILPSRFDRPTGAA